MSKNNEVINCLDSFLALFRGTTNDAQIEDLIEYMVKSSYFFSENSVGERYKYMLEIYENGTLPVRHSTAKGDNRPYFRKVNDNSYARLKTADGTDSKMGILEYQKNNEIFYKIGNKYVNVKIDNDGNAQVRSLINEKSGYWVSNGENGSIKNATISHIWGNATNPFYFTSLWNIVIIPTFCNFILDKNETLNNKGEKEDEKYYNIINEVNKTFQAICWKKYDVEHKHFNNMIHIEKPDDKYLQKAEKYIHLIHSSHILGSK